MAPLARCCGQHLQKFRIGKESLRGSQGVDDLSGGRDVVAKEHLGKFCHVMGKNSRAQKANYNLHYFSEISPLDC